MSGLAEFGVRKPVVANLVMFVLIGAGIIFGINLTREFFPETDPTLIQVTVAYPGASPEEVEDSLAIKIEDRVADFVDDVEEINSTIGEGFVSVMIEFRDGVNIDRAVFDVKREMDGLEDLPAEAREIVVSVFEPNIPTINVSLFGDADERTMKDAIIVIRDDLRALQGMGDVDLSGVRTDEITVEVDPAKLLEHDLGIDRVADTISAAMLELPGGTVRTSTGNTAIRTLGVEESAETVADIVVKGSGGGGVVKLRDIATVAKGFEDIELLARLNGKPAASLTVFKTGDEDAVAMAEAVKAYVAGRRAEPLQPTIVERLLLAFQQVSSEDDLTAVSPVTERMRAWQLGMSRPPAPGELVTTTDLARFITGRLELLSRNAAFGLVLVLATLLLLLNYRVAFWVALGLAVSVLGTLAAMELTGITLNLLTMFGLIIVLGLLVDDAIVVAENIVTKHEDGMEPREAAVRGTGQVTWPVISTVLTTMCAFLPLALIAGQIGDLLAALPFVVTVSLAVSLIESLFILPSHMAHSLEAADRAKQQGRMGLLARFNEKLEIRRERFIKNMIIPAYARVLEVCLHHRYLTFCVAIATLAVSVGMIGGGRVKFSFFPSADSETMSVDLRMPVGTSIDETDAALRIVEDPIVDPQQFPEITAAFTQVGAVNAIDGSSGSTSTNIAQMILELAPVEDRQDNGGRSSADIRAELIRLGAEIPGVESLRIEEVSGGPSGPDMSLAVVGPSGEVVEQVAARVAQALGDFEGVLGVGDDN